MNPNIRRIAIAVIVAAAGAICYLVFKFKPEAAVAVPQKPVPAVEVFTVAASDEPVLVASQGLVEAITRTAVAAEVTGRVIEVDPRFEVGGVFKENAVLLRLDAVSYAAALAQAEATAANAALELELEQGRARQAKRDWDKLGGDEVPTALVQRLPQLESARAAVKAAQAAVEKARVDLDRCAVAAPYDCRVVAKHTDLGTFVPAGARLADLESVGAYEVRLPVPLEDFAFIDVSGLDNPDKRPSVTFAASVGIRDFEWRGEIVRTEGGVDRESRSVYLVARFAPAAEDGGEPMAGQILQPGLFVRATVTGITMDDIAAIPRRALYEGDIVLVVDADNRIERRSVTVLRASVESAYVSAGLKPGERVCLTPINAAVEDMPVRIVAPGKDARDPAIGAEAGGRDQT